MLPSRDLGGWLESGVSMNYSELSVPEPAPSLYSSVSLAHAHSWSTPLLICSPSIYPRAVPESHCAKVPLAKLVTLPGPPHWIYKVGLSYRTEKVKGNVLCITKFSGDTGD